MSEWFTNLSSNTSLTLADLTLWLGALVAVAAVLRLLTVEDTLGRLVAVNITGGGTLLILVGLAVRTEQSDPVPQALALTGIVITVAFTGVGLLLAKAAHDDDAVADEDDEDDSSDNHDAPDSQDTQDNQDTQISQVGQVGQARDGDA